MIGLSSYTDRLDVLEREAIASTPWIVNRDGRHLVLPPDASFRILLLDTDRDRLIIADEASYGMVNTLIHADPMRYRCVAVRFGVDAAWDAMTRMALNRLLADGTPWRVRLGE